jgi:chemotaxis protein CheX
MTDRIHRDTTVKAIIDATQEVFTTMLGLEVQPGAAYLDRETPRPADGVVALIGMAGEWTGTGSIGCSAEFACAICAHLLMTESKLVDDEVLDAVGEVANMVIGNFKNHIEEVVGPLGLSIPTVIFGRNFITRSLSPGEWMVVPFAVADQTFEVRVCLAPVPETRSSRPGFVQSAPVVA